MDRKHFWHTALSSEDLNLGEPGLKRKCLMSLGLSCEMFFWKLSYARMFLLKQTCGAFLESAWKRGRRCLVELERCPLERTHDVWIGYKYHPIDHRRHCAALVHLATLCWSSFFPDNAVALVSLAFFADRFSGLCREKLTKELLVMFWHLLPASADSG